MKVKLFIRKLQKATLTSIQKMKDAGIKIVSPTAKDLKFMDEVAYKHSWPETAKYTGDKVLQDIKKYLGNKISLSFALALLVSLLSGKFYFQKEEM